MLKNQRLQKRRALRRDWSLRSVMFVAQLVGCALVVALLGYALRWFISSSEDLHVHTIRVEGAEMMSEEDVIYQSGVTCDDCIFFVKPEAVRRRLEALPFVAGCRVTRIFPDKLVIAIHERIALATLVANNRCFELDQDCNVLREINPGEAHVGPLITEVAGLKTAEVGQQLSLGALRGAVAVWRAFCKTEMARNVSISEISAAQENRICMYCDDLPCEVRWGRDNFDRQAWKLDLLWRNQRHDVKFKEYIDLRFGDDIACK